MRTKSFNSSVGGGIVPLMNISRLQYSLCSGILNQGGCTYICDISRGYGEIIIWFNPHFSKSWSAMCGGGWSCYPNILSSNICNSCHILLSDSDIENVSIMIENSDNSDTTSSSSPSVLHWMTWPVPPLYLDFTK